MAITRLSPIQYYEQFLMQLARLELLPVYQAYQSFMLELSLIETTYPKAFDACFAPSYFQSHDCYYQTKKPIALHIAEYAKYGSMQYSKDNCDLIMLAIRDTCTFLKRLHTENLSRDPVCWYSSFYLKSPGGTLGSALTTLLQSLNQLVSTTEEHYKQYRGILISCLTDLYQLLLEIDERLVNVDGEFSKSYIFHNQSLLLSRHIFQELINVDSENYSKDDVLLKLRQIFLRRENDDDDHSIAYKKQCLIKKRQDCLTLISATHTKLIAVFAYEWYSENHMTSSVESQQYSLQYYAALQTFVLRLPFIEKNFLLKLKKHCSASDKTSLENWIKSVTLFKPLPVMQIKDGLFENDDLRQAFFREWQDYFTKLTQEVHDNIAPSYRTDWQLAEQSIGFTVGEWLWQHFIEMVVVQMQYVDPIIRRWQSFNPVLTISCVLGHGS